MKRKETHLNLQTLVNLQKPDYDESFSDFPSQDKIKFRRDRVNRLRIRGYSNYQIAEKIGCSLSTIEKDLSDIRERSKNWYEQEAITDYCQSLQDSIILCDNAIEDLKIIYSECDNLELKIKILGTISDFEERKTKLYMKTGSVQNYLNQSNLENLI